MNRPARELSATMAAAIFRGNEHITIERVPIPRVDEGEVLVRVGKTALCGSDFKLWHKGAEFTAGHEIFGRVEQPGHRLHDQRCCIYIPLHCGHCASCRRGDTQMCLEVSSLIGWNRPGGYAEYVLVPENCLLPVPDDIEDRLAPLLLDTIGTSAHAVRFAGRTVPPGEGSSVLVTGAGPVGLGVVLALQAVGYDDILVSDPNEERLDIARSFGARPHPTDDTSRLFALIVECSGAHAARNRGINVVLPGGAVVLVGENAAPWTITEDKVFRRKDFHMIRTFYFPKSDLDLNIALLRAHKNRYASLIDAEFGLDALPDAFARFAHGEYVKPLLAME
ncbi:MAG: alcohol dehydrogenase catalytic domain-containing protein [Methylobacteriaceae bacterium]|nr:alcohol dehydrogenase catalytic domain-containing protein [Methylobacteriaceae bacterium]